MGGYLLIKEENAVLVRVPKKSDFMERKRGFIANCQKVGPHWTNGKPLMNGLFLNFFFYGISEHDLGKSIVGKVEVIEKITDTGRVFTIINVRHTPGVEPKYNLKLPFKKEGTNGCDILHSDQMIEFRKKEKIL